MRRAILIVALVFGLLAAAAWAARDDTRLVSRAAGGSGAKGNAASALSGVSGDGRVIAFDSTATNLSADDGDATRDVFVRDRATVTTTLASRAGGVAGAAGNANAFGGRVSADGGSVAFSSIATNLHPDDADATSDIHVRDLDAATTTLASRADGVAGAKGNGGSSQPAISATGRFVAFASTATNLPDDGDATSDVFLRDLVAGTTVLVSRANGAAGVKGNGASFAPSISADGRRVAWTSAATNLDPSDPDGTQDIYVRDVDTTITTLVSRASVPGGAKGNAASLGAQLAAGGGIVAFSSAATNLSPEGVAGIFVRDVENLQTTLASRATGAAGAPANGGVLGGTLSFDGRYVAFSSSATNLDPADTDALGDVFLRDRQAATTTLLSRASSATGAKGNGQSSATAISNDGAVVAFESAATNLDPADGDTAGDVFTRELTGAPAEPTPTPTPSPPPGGAGGGPAAPPGEPAQAPTPTPAVGRSELLQPVSGVVRIRRRGTRRFVRLRAGQLLPDRSEIDATRGVVRVVVARRDGTTESALISEGRAIVDQNTGRRPVTTLKLSLPLACARPGKASAAAKKKRKRARRRMLFTRTDGGHFRTRGNHAAATASGTAWRTTDRCRSTRIDVREGTVAVRDRVKRRTVRVKAPRSYTARRR